MNAVIHKLKACPKCCCSQTLPVDVQTCPCPCHPKDRGGARFTYDEVCAMQFARRMLVKSIPDQDCIIRSLIDNQLRFINAALTKMEDACDGQ